MTFPGWGRSTYLYRPFTELGHQVVPPPPVTKRTLIWVKHAPEFACLPFKMTLANYIEAIEKGRKPLSPSGVRGRAGSDILPRCKRGFFMI